MAKIPRSEQQSPYGPVAEDDPGDDDAEELIWRFRDLKRKKIVGNWTTLLAWIASEGFPVGVMLGPNSRGWIASDVRAWLQSRPTAGAAKRDHATYEK
jgi:hypothetical protein